MAPNQIPQDAIQWRFEALAEWHRQRFGRQLPYALLERRGEFVLSNSQGHPLAPVKEALELHDLIVILCAECAVQSPVKQFCIDCARHQESCCQCGVKDTDEMPKLPADEPDLK